MTNNDLLKMYLDLHEGLSDMVESGRLKEADIPDDYLWLVETLETLERMTRYIEQFSKEVLERAENAEVTQ